jgi:hypothetical protein
MLMLSVVMRNVIYAECRNKARFAKCHIMGPVFEPTQVELLTELHYKGGFYIVCNRLG